MSAVLRRGTAALLGLVLLTTLLALWPDTPARASSADAVARASAWAQARGGQVGIAVLDRDTGQLYENGGLAHTRMRSASVPKILVAESLLDRSRRGEISLSQRDRELMESMVIGSDDAAMSTLYSRFGGLSMVHSVTAKYGLSEIGDPPTPGYWGMFRITAHDIVKFYDGMLNGGLQPADRDYLVSLMRRATPRGTDGFDQYFGIPRGLPNQVWGIKQGWMCCQEDQRRLHSTGILGADNRFLVAVLSQVPETQSYAHLGETMTHVVRTLFPGGVIPPSEVGNNPIGNLDGVGERWGGVVRVQGWAGDPDTPTSPIDVHVYLDGGFAAVARADRDRPDVGAARPDYGSRHGFDLDLGASPGQHRVCVYAIDVVKGTTNPSLGCRTVTVTPAGPFRDVPAASPFAADVQWLSDRGITTGHADGTFRPAERVSRQSMAAFLYRLTHAGAEAPRCTAAPFPDMPAQAPFCGAVAWLAGQDVIDGYEDGSFQPEAPVTRQAMAAFLHRLHTGGAEVAPCTSAAFADVPAGHGFCGPIAWMVGERVAAGYPDRTFRPEAQVTRQAMAAFLHRYAAI